jgi:hypothetical protein
MRVWVGSLLVVGVLILFVLVVWWIMNRNEGTMPRPKDRSPGWRADPIGPGERYWDGQRWTEESRPNP